MNRPATLARLAAFAAIVLWGISFVATKAALRELPPVPLIALRTGMGVALLLVMLAARRQPLVPPRAEWRWLAGMGFVGIFVHLLIQAEGLKYTSATNTGWLIGLIPIWSAALAAIFLRERFGRWKIAGLAVGFAGALIVVTRGRPFGELLGVPSTRGDLLILASTLNWAICTIMGHGTLRRLGAARATAGAMFLGWAMLVPLFLAQRGWTYYTDLSPTTWGAVLFLGIGSSGLGYLFWYGALERIEASRVAAFLYIEPLVTLAAASAWLGERAGPATIVGGIVLLAGVALVQYAPEGRRSSIAVRALEPADREWAHALLRERWASTRIVSRGCVTDAAEMRGFVAWDGDGAKRGAKDGARVGLAMFCVRDGGEGCEVLTLDSVRERSGAGSALLAAVEAEARRAGCARLWLVTTNDNTGAQRFYRRRGFKPAIPERSAGDVPIRDEIEFEKPLA